MMSKRQVHCLVQALTVVALLFASLSAMTAEVWLSGPSTFWVNGGREITAAVTRDFRTVLGSEAQVISVVPQVAPSTPAIGSVVIFTPPAGMTDKSALDMLYAADFPTLNEAGSVISVTVHALRVMPTAAVLAHSGKTAMSGPSFFWSVVLDEPSVDSAALVLPLEVDVQKAVDASEQTYLVHILSPTEDDVNASAMFVNYEWWNIGDGSLTAEQLTDELNAAPLTSFNTYLRTLVEPDSPMYEYRDLVPDTLEFTRALYEDPEAAEDVAVPIVSTTVTHVLMYFSGSSAGWDRTTKVLPKTVASEAAAALQRGGYTNTATVDAVSYETSDDDTIGGLVVKATVTQGAQEGAAEPWDGDSVASVLLLGTYSATLALYTGEGEAELVAVRLDKGYGFKCTAGCVGMIIMTAIIVFLMIVAIVLICVCVRCCIDDDEPAAKSSVSYGYDRSDRFVPTVNADDPQKRTNPLVEF